MSRLSEPKHRGDIERPLPTPLLRVEDMGVGEQRISFRSGDSWCRASSIDLRSGARLGVTVCHFEPAFSFQSQLPPSELEFVISKGSVLHTRTEDGCDLERGGNTLQLGQTKRTLPLRVVAPGEVRMQCVSVSMSRQRLRELLGGPGLPEALRSVSESRNPHALVSRAMTPRLFGLLDEISNADVKGRSRALWFEAKCLELIACVTDELAETEVIAARLSADDVERLERVRRSLVERLDAPPTLTQLARAAGINETKLKACFRARFGTSVFAYLRLVRMQEARRLLLEQKLSVTDVAQRVGYENPSKFAAAFRKQFGMSPSAL